MTLFITDGSMSIKAIEYEHIPALKKEILPGQKVSAMKQKLFVIDKNN